MTSFSLYICIRENKRTIENLSWMCAAIISLAFSSHMFSCREIAGS